MFTNLAEKNHDRVVLKQLNSTALRLLVNFIYSGEIMITAKNVQVLLPAAIRLQLQDVKVACCDFLLSQLCPTNCISINTLADLHSCTELLTSSELYIQQHFSEVVGREEFLSLSSKQVIKLISSDKLTVPSEEKVFESVIRWVEHELGSRKCILPQLMEHVRLPLASKNYILKKVVEDPLIKNCLKCNHYVIEALNFHILKSEELIPQNIRNKPRHGDKVIFVIGRENSNEIETNCSEWFDPNMNQWNFGPELISIRERPGLAVVKDNLVFAVGGSDDGGSIRTVEILDLSSESPSWKLSVDMLVDRRYLGLGVINDNLYAVGGQNYSGSYLDIAEVFDYNTKKWHMISSMTTMRCDFGVGVLNNLLYAVGGIGKTSHALKSVECYHPSLDAWKPIPKMSVGRSGVGVGVLDGVLYAIGGHNGSTCLSSVKAYRPSTGVWTSVGSMNLPRQWAEVVVLNGLLYVVSGHDGTSFLDSTECYSPETNTWTFMTASMNDKLTSVGAVAINRPLHFKTN